MNMQVLIFVLSLIASPWGFRLSLEIEANRISCVQINFTKVPQAIKNNTGDSVVLDCGYSVRPDDTELVVKWFLNDELVYQWVPPKHPQSLGALKDRLDLRFKASGDPKGAYRALKILNPTTDIAGEYKCYVSTFVDEDFSIKNMIVFEPEKTLTLTKSRTYGTHQNFSCQATEVYPEPKLLLYKDKDHQDTNDNSDLESVEWVTKKHPSGKFSLTVTSTIKTSQLGYGSLVFCELSIPGTGYGRRRSLLYYPPGGIGRNNVLYNTVPICLLMLCILCCFDNLFG